MKMSKMLLSVIASSVLAGAGTAAADPYTPTLRGAVVETERYRAEIADGAMTGFLNKLTGEQYVEPDNEPSGITPHLPTGLATQSDSEELEAAALLYRHYWFEHPTDADWPNQHFPHADSEFSSETRDDGLQLTYRGLTDGERMFPDETFSLHLAVDPENGDLLITPSATSPRTGVYGTGFTVLPLAGDISIEAPIFEGVRLDRTMDHNLWINVWANYWDYSFVALNGADRGAVGLWTQDAEMRYYKAFFTLINDQGISLAVQNLNIPPFNDLTEAPPLVTWRMQAFDKTWAQAAARFRDWRVRNVRFAERPEWVRKLAFMHYGMHHAPANHMDMIETYFENRDTDRVISWAPAVRGAGFDKNHSNNTPYEGFREDMAKWKERGHKLMVYLQPMIMWGANPSTERERQGVKFSREAMTRQLFHTDNDTITKGSQHNLGSPRWQRWFLDWVKEYIQEYGADGIYHDQSYSAIIDARGASAPGGMTTPQGIADYFYKAATENPGTIHATEHMTEANSVGASLGLGCGVLWGTPGYKGEIGPRGSMNHQRIKKASPISNALHAPHGRIVGFPHFSNFSEKGHTAFHHGMDQMERRGDLPAIPLGSYHGLIKPEFLPYFINEVQIDRLRALAFVRHGLSPVFPEDWAPDALTYFRGEEGEDFRYEKIPHGTRFVQHVDGRRRLVYARITGTTHVTAETGGIAGWPCYDGDTITGLDPDKDRYYCIDGSREKPDVWISLPADDLKVVDGYSDPRLLILQTAPLDESRQGPRTLTLHAPAAPQAVWIDGVAVQPTPKSEGQWELPARASSRIVAWLAPLDEMPEEKPNVAIDATVCRQLDKRMRSDILDPAAYKKVLVPAKGGFRISTPRGINAATQLYLPIQAPATQAGTLRLTARLQKNAPPTVRINGDDAAFVPIEGTPSCELTISLKAGELALLTLVDAKNNIVKSEWTPR